MVGLKFYNCAEISLVLCCVLIQISNNYIFPCDNYRILTT